MGHHTSGHFNKNTIIKKEGTYMERCGTKGTETKTGTTRELRGGAGKTSVKRKVS